VEGFFDFHEHELKSIIPQDHTIFCVDERGITAVQHSKFAAQGANKKWRLLTSEGRRNLITLIACMNATSMCVPPLIVFQKKKSERGACGWSTGGLNFGLPSKMLDSD
jgi:hypothetical protein